MDFQSLRADPLTPLEWRYGECLMAFINKLFHTFRRRLDSAKSKRFDTFFKALVLFLVIITEFSISTLERTLSNAISSLLRISSLYSGSARISWTGYRHLVDFVIDSLSTYHGRPYLPALGLYSLIEYQACNSLQLVRSASQRKPTFVSSWIIFLILLFRFHRWQTIDARISHWFA